MNMKKLLALLLAVVMVFGIVACTPADPTNPGTNPTDPTDPKNPTDPSRPAYVVETFEGDFVYKDWVGTLATNWNPHTYQVDDDSYPIGFTSSGLYELWFNDELNPKEGKAPFEGFVVMPEMALSLPVDVTEQIKAQYPQFGIPESATEGFAYTIELNPDACFADGTPITAETWEKSMELLLRPELNNYRAADYYARGDFKIAGARAYNNAGKTTYTDDASCAIDTLTLNENGQYITAEGKLVYVAVDFNLAYFDGNNSLADYVNAYGATNFDVSRWEELVALANEEGLAPLTAESYEMLKTTITGNPNWNEDESYLPNYIVCVDKSYPIDLPYEGTVGVWASDEYELTVVLENALSGFYLYINLGGWLVDPVLYESCLTETNGAWTSNYNTSAETSNSYGPYKVSEYQTDKYIRFVRNENWWGYEDGKHIYKDPVDGKIYPMYQTTEIYCQVVAEAATAKMMFMAGELMTYGLQTADFASLKNSEYAYTTPAETIFCLIMNGHLESIQKREAAADFDKSTTDLETMTVDSFRRAMALVYDKNLLCEVISPSRTAGLGILGSTYVYDVENALYYRETEQAKRDLCDFYSVDVSKFASLDDAVASITGYDPEGAKKLFTQAFADAIEAGYITDANGDGISDQTVTMEYCLSADDSFQQSLIAFLNQYANEAAKGTPFEGKILIKGSPVYGNEWSNMIRNGMSDCVLGGFGGSNLNPFSTMASYLDPNSSFDGAWNDTSKVDMTLELNGESITMSVLDWVNCVNGSTITVNGKDYNFGEGMADTDIRLEILAALEGAIMKTYNHIPMIQNQGTTLLSQQVYYVVEEYNPILGGRGGITYLKYDYNEAEWAAYIAEQGGELTY